MRTSKFVLCSFVLSVFSVGRTLGDEIPYFVGNKPVVTNIRFEPAIPEAGKTVSVLYDYTDEDGDEEFGTLFEWRLDGIVLDGVTSSSYLLPLSSSGKELQVYVTPQSKPTAVPAIGNKFASKITLVSVASIGKFVLLSRNTNDYPAAVRGCERLSPPARIATKKELQELFLEYTSATKLGDVNYEMCDIYGLPLNNQCGGLMSTYWMDEEDWESSFSPAGVNLDNGLVRKTITPTAPYYSLCIR
ncbi:UNVERIFIED_ORG: hypothetical protein DFO51_102573 [Aeromonas veronii]